MILVKRSYLRKVNSSAVDFEYLRNSNFHEVIEDVFNADYMDSVIYEIKEAQVFATYCPVWITSDSTLRLFLLSILLLLLILLVWRVGRMDRLQVKIVYLSPRESKIATE